VIEVDKEQSTKTELNALKISESKDSKIETQKSKNKSLSVVGQSLE